MPAHFFLNFLPSPRLFLSFYPTAWATCIMADPVLFDSQFTVNAIDPDGKKFERGECVDAQC